VTLIEVGETAAASPGAGELAGGAPPGIARPRRVEVWRRFKRNRLAMVGLFFVLFLLLVALFAPLIAPLRSDRADAGLVPAGAVRRPLVRDGPDRPGRVQPRRPRRPGVAADVAVGGGHLVDTVAMRLVDVFLAIPYIILAVALATIVGRSENSVILILGLIAWLGISRIVRASFLSLKQLEYVEAARALGFSPLRVMFRHVLPNALQPIIVYGTISVGSLILSEAARSFLGVGPQEPTPAWGLMVRDAKGLLSSAPHLLLFPDAAIFFTVLAFVFVGDGLRDALDPKLKQ
jgi:peptide/nickel transport system permease protein